MKFQGATSLNIALIHHPVVNKRAEIIGSAVTNLDIHDIARMARTYGVENYFITTPYNDQHLLVEELLEHWDSGHGATYNPARKEALSIVSLCNSVDKAIEKLTGQYGKKPLLVTTSAHKQSNMILYDDLREIINNRDPVLLLFGTAHGLAPEVMKNADGTLPPIVGRTDYNHLSVRSAASVIIDRLLGSREG